MVDITRISAILAAAGVLAGVAYYILEMIHQSKVARTVVQHKVSPSNC